MNNPRMNKTRSRVQFPIRHDYTGAQVTWTIKDRVYLADVVGQYHRETPSAWMFKVRYFNGEDAGEVAAAFVEILHREYDTDLTTEGRPM